MDRLDQVLAAVGACADGPGSEMGRLDQVLVTVGACAGVREA